MVAVPDVPCGARLGRKRMLEPTKWGNPGCEPTQRRCASPTSDLPEGAGNATALNLRFKILGLAAFAGGAFSSGS